MSDDTYTLKEMMQELRSETKTQSSALSRIEAHLATLNSKVATHEKLHGEYAPKFEELSSFRSKAMAVWGVAVFVVGVVVNKLL